jgi:hypothetical protein
MLSGSATSGSIVTDDVMGSGESGSGRSSRKGGVFEDGIVGGAVEFTEGIGIYGGRLFQHGRIKPNRLLHAETIEFIFTSIFTSWKSKIKMTRAIRKNKLAFEAICSEGANDVTGNEGSRREKMLCVYSMGWHPYLLSRQEADKSRCRQ